MQVSGHMSNEGGSMKVKEECKSYQETSGIVVDVRKLSVGLKTTFEGISAIFDSLGMRFDIQQVTENLTSNNAIPNTQVSEKQSPHGNSLSESNRITSMTETGGENTASNVSSEIREMTDTLEQVERNENIPSSKSAKSSISLDDITKVIVEKIKQNRGNREKIEAIVLNYGVSVISQLAEAKYEAFLAELASL